MEIWLEVSLKKIEKIKRLVKSTSSIIECYDLPESPAGYPALNSIALSIYMRHVLNVCTIPHIRLYDINTNALLSIANALEELGINRLVLLKGDKPVYGESVEELTSEKALEILKQHGYKLEIGLILSLNYPLEEIYKRLEMGADFYLAINVDLNRIGKYAKVWNYSSKKGIKLYSYLLIGTENNIDLFKKLNQPFVALEEIPTFVKNLQGMTDGFIVSAPKEYERMKEIVMNVKNSLMGP